MGATLGSPIQIRHLLENTAAISLQKLCMDFLEAMPI
jgi:hypothetical protein